MHRVRFIIINMFEDQRDLVSNQMYIVQRILKKRSITKGKTTKIQYLVKWQDYDSADNTWEPLENLVFQRKLAEKKQLESRELSKTKSTSNDNQQIVNPKEKRYEKENGSKMRKLQSGSIRNVQTVQSIRQVKQENPPVRQTHRQPKEASRKSRYSETNSEVTWKNKYYIDIEDNYELNLPKDHKHNKEKQAKQNLQREICDKKEKKQTSKYEESFGKVVNHIYRDGQLFYEVEKLSNNQKVLKIQQLTREEVERSCMQGAYQYLCKLLISLQEARS